MKAMIFAAGMGKRLGGITRDLPKALVDVGGKTILRRAVEKVSASGFDDIIVNVHHYATLIEKEIAVLKSEGYRISVSDERESLLETGGGLFKARWFFDTDPFLLYSADIITDLDLSSLLSYHRKKEGIATLAVAPHNHSRVFLLDKDDLLCGWRNKSKGEEIIAREPSSPLTEISFSAIHIAEPSIFGHMQEGVYTMTELYLRLASEFSIYGYRHDSDYWVDIGSPEELEKARARF